MRKVLVVLLAGLVLGGCFVALTGEEKAELLSAKEKFETAAELLGSVKDDLGKLKAEGARLKERFGSGELSVGDYAKAKAELDVFLDNVESKWKLAKDDFDSARNGYSAVQKKIKERSGSGAGAWLQAILGGFGMEIPVGVIAVLEYIRRKRRERQVGLLSRAGAKTGEGKTFGEALMEEAPMDRNALRVVEKAAAEGAI